MTERNPVDGEPYFCITCGDAICLMESCEHAAPDDDPTRGSICDLESRYQAQQRKALYDALKAKGIK